MLSVMGAFAEFERALLRERQREGIALAKQRGVYRVRKHSLSDAENTEVRMHVVAGKKRPGRSRFWHQSGNLVQIPSNERLNMPVGFMNKTQQVQLSSFPDAINHNDLITYFTLTDQDRRVLPSRSSATNRLGFAVQLCALRFMGFFIKEMARAPTIIIEFLREQLAHNEASDLSGYGHRPQTRTDHIKTIEKHLGFRSTDAAYENKLQTWLVSRAL